MNYSMVRTVLYNVARWLHVVLVFLRAEMRELDSERQSLVYNHHHELIAASDTIAAVYLPACMLFAYMLILNLDESTRREP
jgi:hypothetical protein